MTGTLDINLSLNGLKSNGKIAGGSLVATFGNGEFTTFTVTNNSSNVLSTDATGSGTMPFSATLDHSIMEWDGILFDKNRLTMDLVIDTSGQITLSSPPPAPHSPMDHSDHNDDGVLDYNTDFGTFLIDHVSNEDRADINADNVWDQEDIDLWISDFIFDEEQL